MTTFQSKPVLLAFRQAIKTPWFCIFPKCFADKLSRKGFDTYLKVVGVSIIKKKQAAYMIKLLFYLFEGKLLFGKANTALRT